MTPASGSRSRPWRRSRSEYSRRGSARRKPSRGRSARCRAARGLGPPARGEQYEQTPPAEARLYRGGAMNFGVWIPNCRHLATPDIIRSTAVRAEQLGYDSVWVSDHVVVPHANVKNFGETVFDPLVTLAVAAGATRRVRLGTTVLIVPYRNAVVTAKMIDSLDALSGGRVVLGIGAGWVAGEGARRRRRSPCATTSASFAPARARRPPRMPGACSLASRPRWSIRFESSPVSASSISCWSSSPRTAASSTSSSPSSPSASGPGSPDRERPGGRRSAADDGAPQRKRSRPRLVSRGHGIVEALDPQHRATLDALHGARARS